MKVKENKIPKLFGKANSPSDKHSYGNNVDRKGPSLSLSLPPLLSRSRPHPSAQLKIHPTAKTLKDL